MLRRKESYSLFAFYYCKTLAKYRKPCNLLYNILKYINKIVIGHLVCSDPETAICYGFVTEIRANEGLAV